MSERFENERIAALAAYQPRSRTDRRGIVWNLLPPGTTTQAGDVIEDAGVWRPQPTISQCTSRYDRAVFVRVEAQRHHDAMLAQYGPDALPTISAKNRLDAAWQAQRQALRDADDPVIQGATGSTHGAQMPDARNTTPAAARPVPRPTQTCPA